MKIEELCQRIIIIEQSWMDAEKVRDETNPEWYYHYGRKKLAQMILEEIKKEPKP